ncbi:MAG: hypothetical protein V8R62_08740 [Faecalibacillus intestinalis]
MASGNNVGYNAMATVALTTCLGTYKNGSLFLKLKKIMMQSSIQ